MCHASAAAHPDYTLGETGRELGAMWSLLSLEDKQPYQVCWLCSSASVLSSYQQMPHMLHLLEQEKAADDKQRAQKERTDAGLGTPAARKVTKLLAASRTEDKASDSAADTESGQAQAEDGGEAVQAPAAKGTGAKKTKVRCPHMAMLSAHVRCAFHACNHACRSRHARGLACLHGRMSVPLHTE